MKTLTVFTVLVLAALCAKSDAADLSFTQPPAQAYNLSFAPSAANTTGDVIDLCGLGTALFVIFDSHGLEKTFRVHDGGLPSTPVAVPEQSEGLLGMVGVLVAFAILGKGIGTARRRM